jgi:hypothetical protein
VRHVFVGVELVSVTDPDTGETRQVPDLGADIRSRIARTGPDLFTVTWGEHAFTGLRLGRLAGVLWFIGCGDRRILVGLAHLGANIRLCSDVAKNNPTLRNQLRSTFGLRVIRRVSDGAILGFMPRIVLADVDNPMHLGLDYEVDDTQTYEEIA